MQRQNRNKSNLLWPLANRTAVNNGMSLAISCCQPPNRSTISLTTLRGKGVEKGGKKGERGEEGTGIKEGEGRDGGGASRQAVGNRREERGGRGGKGRE